MQPDDLNGLSANGLPLTLGKPQLRVERERGHVAHGCGNGDVAPPMRGDDRLYELPTNAAAQVRGCDHQRCDMNHIGRGIRLALDTDGAYKCFLIECTNELLS